MDPGFRGTLIDSLNLAEKHGLIADARKWRRIQELQNVASHDYASNDLKALFEEVKMLTPTILAISDVLK